MKKVQEIKTKSLGKVQIRQTNEDTNYATDESVLEFLHTLQARDGLPVFDFLSYLCIGKVNSVSLSKDDPYRYFFARAYRNNISMTMKEESKTVELQLPLDALKRFCNGPVTI